MHCAPHIVSFVIHRLHSNKYRFFIMQFFRTCDKCKDNMLYKRRMVACSGCRRRLKHWATTLTIRVRSPIVTKFLYLEILCCQFSLYQQRLWSTFLSFWRLWVMLNYQRDVLVVGGKFGEEKGAYLYFVESIKRDLRRF